MKIMKFCLVIMMGLVFFFSVSASGLAQAVDPEKEEKIYRLDKVIVRDHPLKNEAMVVTPEVTIINVDKFKKAGPIDNLQDLLSETLGLDVLPSNITPSPSDSVYIRGLDASRIQLFVDGRPARLFGGFGYYKIDWSTWPLDNIETIEVIRGSHSLLFPFAMGGAINIITKKGIKTDKVKPKATVKTEYGSYGKKGYSASLLGGLFNTIGYSIAGGHKKGDGYLRNNYFDTDNVSGRLSLYLPTDGIISVGLDYVDTTTGYAVINDPSRADYDPSYPIVTQNVDKFTHDYQGSSYPGGKSFWDKRAVNQNILFEHPMGPGEIRAQLWKHESSRDNYYFNKNGVQIRSDDVEEHIWGVTLDLMNFALGNHAFTVGGYYNIMGASTPTGWDNKDWMEILSGYIQDEWSITPSLTATYGFRSYRYEVDAWRPNHIGPWFNYDYRRVEKEFCPKAKLDYQFKPDLSLYAAVSREMRTE